MRAVYAVMLLVIACGGADIAVPVPVKPTLICEVTVSPDFVTVSVTKGASVTVTSKYCDNVSVNAPTLASPFIAMAGIVTVDIPAGGTADGFVRAVGSPRNGPHSVDSIPSFFLRAVGMQLIRDGLPSSAPANSTVHFRLLGAVGTSCGFGWDPLAPSPDIGGLAPQVTRNPKDTTIIDLTLPNWASPVPVTIAVNCVGQDKSTMTDFISVVSTIPQLTSIDSITPREVHPDVPVTYHVYAHGCPFIVGVGQRGVGSNADGTLYFAPSVGTIPSGPPESAMQRMKAPESCNQFTFVWTWADALSPTGSIMHGYIRNAGQPAVEVEFKFIRP